MAPTATKPASNPSGCPVHALLEWREAGAIVPRLAVLGFGLAAYAAFFVTFLYAIGFTTGLVVPKSINDGAVVGVVSSLLVNAGLLAAFVVQHTIMARPRFKAWVTRFIPESIERSLFVLLASACLAATFWLWRPLPGTLWSVQAAWLWWTITSVALLGWGVVLFSSFMVSHFDLFGVRQVATNAMGRAYEPVSFRLVGFYRLVRHPLMTGFLIAFWITPEMTLGHLFFAVMCTGYIVLGTKIEERDLIASFGERYLVYRRSTPGLIPNPWHGRGRRA
ncbi:MAG: methanethiol S-methyltransferase [Planctomycetota bacterium]